MAILDLLKRTKKRVDDAIPDFNLTQKAGNVLRQANQIRQNLPIAQESRRLTDMLSAQKERQAEQARLRREREAQARERRMEESRRRMDEMRAKEQERNRQREENQRKLRERTSAVGRFVADIPKGLLSQALTTGSILADTGVKGLEKAEDIVTAPLGKKYKERLQNVRKRQSEAEDRILSKVQPLEEKKGEGFKNYLKGAYNQAVPTLRDVKTATPLQRVAAIADAALTIGTGGAFAGLKQAGKQGAKQVAKQYAKTAGLGAAGGAAGTATQKDATAGDITKGAVGGAIFGAGLKGAGDVAPIVAKKAGSTLSKAKEGIASALQEPKFKPGFASTKPKVEIVKDPTKRQQIINSVLEGDLTLRTKRFNNRKLSPEELNVVQRSVDSGLKKLGIKSVKEIRDIEGFTPAPEVKEPKASSASSLIKEAQERLQTKATQNINPQVKRLQDLGATEKEASDLIKSVGFDKAQNALSSIKDAPDVKNRGGLAYNIATGKTKPREISKPLTEFGDLTPEGKLKSDIKVKPTIKLATTQEPKQPTVKLQTETPIIPRTPRQLAEEAVQKATKEPISPEIAPVAGVFTKAEPSIPETIKESRLGSIIDDFYQSKKGDKKITFQDLETLGKNVAAQTKQDLESIGSSFQDVAKKIQVGARNRIKKLEDAGLSSQEANIIRKAQSEMNFIRRRASTKGSKKIGEGDLGEMYLPQQKAGFDTRESLFTGFRAEKPGSEFKRQNKIELEDLDLSTKTIADYITQYGDTKLYKAERVARALQRENPNVDKKLIQKATSQFIDIQDKINSIKTKIELFGLGNKTQVDSTNKVVNSAAELSKIGDTLGLEKQTVIGQPKGLTIGDRINSVDINGKKLGDIIGLNQYRDADTFASKQFNDAAGDRTKLSQFINNRLKKEYDLLPETVDYLTKRIDNLKANLPDEVVLSSVLNTYKAAAKEQIINKLQRLNIQNPELQRNVSDLTNQILREGSIESQLSNKVVKGILKAQNALFRKLNVSSAINELSDLTSFSSVYGKDFLTSVVPDFNTIKEFGLGEIDAAIEPFIRQIKPNKGIKNVLSKINGATNLYKFVETYKAALLATASKKANMAKGLTGDDLTKAVLNEYRQLALPVDAFTKTALDNFPLYTQYLTWGVRNLQKEKRLALGEISAGNLQDMSQVQRAFRNAYVNLPAKTVFWLSSNALKGTAILTAFGLTDFTGITSEDFSGIQEKDKTLLNKITKYTNISTTASILASILESYQKEELKEQYKDEDYNPYEFNNFGKDLLYKYTPAVVRNVRGTLDLLDKGYSENKAGRIQYEAPTTAYDATKGFLFGKGNTEKARDNSGTTSIFGREGNVFSNIKDMALEQLNIKDTNYSRPLTKQYSEAYKSATKDNRPDLFKGGKEFNAYLDNLERNNPDDYNAYMQSLDGNHVNPEYWKAISSGQDFNIFKTIRNRNKQKYKDLGIPYDPIYNLSDEQAKAVLQQKSTATGDDIALKNALYKEGWYRDFMKDTQEYYKNKKPFDGESKEQTDRVKQWYELDDKYNQLRNIKTDDGKPPEWAKKYPLVYQSKAINDKFGFDSQESKNFYKNNGNNYKAQKALYDAENLDLINQMRAIEGVPSLGQEAYSQLTNIKNTSGSDKWDNNKPKKEKVPKAKDTIEILRLKRQKLPTLRLAPLKAKTPVLRLAKSTKSEPKKLTVRKIRVK